MNKVCIFSSETSRVYIGFSFVLSESAILYEVNDKHLRLTRSDIMSHATVTICAHKVSIACQL